MAEVRARSSPTLQRTWRRAVAKFMVLIAAVGFVAYGATAYQGTVYSATTSRFDDQMEAFLDIDQALLAIDGLLTTLLSESDGDEAALAHFSRGYGPARDQMNGSFAVLNGIVSPATRDVLAETEAYWHQTDEAVRAATRSLATEGPGTLAEWSPTSFAALFAPIEAVSATLIDVRALAMTDLREQTARADDVQRAIPLLLAAALVVALVVAGLVARQIGSLVVHPIFELRRAARTMRDSEASPSISLPGAAAELQELAAALDDTSHSLRVTHGRLRDQAHTDALTNLPNRKAFFERLTAAIDGPHRPAVLFIDLDDFKGVNDTRGHAAGDELLRLVARRLETCVRRGELVARLGGDEFAVLLDVRDDPASAVAVAKRILAALQEDIVIEGRPLALGCSVGVAIGSTDDPPVHDADQIMRQADMAMYVAKHRGKNGYEVAATAQEANAIR